MSTNSSDKLKLRLEMLSDWHVGKGTGIPGNIDAMLARDGDGFPCVPAKTIVGMWRDAMETLTLGLDNGDPNNKVWQTWVDVIFGSQPNVVKIPTDTPRPSILFIEPARLNKNLRDAIGKDTRLMQALTFIKPNTAIDSVSGAAKSESLRMTEMGRVGTVLEAELQLNFELLSQSADEQKEFIRALLVASAALVERIGGDRRRGSGRCSLEIEGEGIPSRDEAVDTIKKYKAVQDFPAVKRETYSIDTPQSASGNGWKRYKYSLKLHTPVAIVTNTLGNVSESLDFIPGTYLLPHISKHLRGISKYMASGDFQVSPATIDVHGKRGLAVPRVIYHRKVEGGFDKPGTIYNSLEESIGGEPQKKSYREGYISSIDDSGTLPFYETTKRTLLMHNTVDDPVQRPTETVGGVYSRQAIKAGTVLYGEIRMKAAVANNLSAQNENWINQLNGSVRLGTSKKDDYGLAELTVEELREDPPKPIINGGELIVYLESDVLLRNRNLRQTNSVDVLKVELEKTLGKNTLANKKDRSLIQVRRIESWHEGWGFPRPTFTAMAAGSVAVFDVTGAIGVNKLLELELSGIGERRGEGYGRIRFNPPLLKGRINEWIVAPKNGSLDEKREQEQKLRDKAITGLNAEVSEVNAMKKFIETVELAAWRDELSRAVLKCADDPQKRTEVFGFKIEIKDGKKHSIPSLSQISSLRSVITRVKPDGSNRKIVIDWLNHLQETENRKKYWEAGFGKIGNLFGEGKEYLLWETIKAHWTQPEVLISDETRLKETLWPEAVKSLFDACARAHKRETEK